MKLRVLEEFWGINRRTGKRTIKQTDEKIIDIKAGQCIEMPIGRRVFSIDEVSTKQIIVSVHYQNTIANKTWMIKKGESIFYRPLAMDGGYQYTLLLEDDEKVGE